MQQENLENDQCNYVKSALARKPYLDPAIAAVLSLSF